MTTRNHDDETITRRKARTISLLGAAVLTLVVSGCGGGGGVAVTPPAEPPPTAPSADVPTLAEVYSSDTPQDQPLDINPVGLSIDYGSDTTTSDDLTSSDDLPFVITSIRRNSGGGYDITGHHENSPDDEFTAQFLPEHCNADGCRIPRNEDGIDFYMWTMLAPHTQQLSLNSEYDYFGVLHLNIDELNVQNQRNMIVFGVGTPAAAIPTRGEAIYQTGYFRADAYRHNSGDGNFRQRFSGAVRIVANFDMSSLNGRVFSVRGSEPGSSNRVSWPTSSFSITDGQINSEGQFTATLTGLDSNSNTPFSESVRGFVGQILGQFFGPNAEELGGVLSASRDVTGTDNDRNLYGYIASKKFGPSKTLGSTGFIASILRDFSARTSQLQDSDATAMVERTASGWKVTASGRTFELSDSDFGSNPQYPYTYVKSLSEGEEVYLWTLTEGFWRNSEFNNFDVKGWALSKTSSSGSTTSSTYDYIVHGDVTSSSAMPTSGTATYNGRMEAIEFPSDDAISSTDSTRYRGDVALTADFANAEVDGVIDDLESRVGRGSYSSADGGATFSASINGSNITATDLNGTGDLSGYQNGNVRGAFFGPSAEEAAGVFDAQDQANDKILTGWFGTAKGTTPPAVPPPAVPPADVPTLAEVYSSDTPQDHSLDTIPVGLTVDFDSDTTTSDDLDSSEDLPFVITSIRRSSGGGYDITGHNENSPNDEVTVQFLPEHCNAEECHLPRNEDGIEYYLWTEHAPYTQQLSVNSEFDYLGVLGFSAWGLPDSKAQRKFIVFGVGTPAAAVPTRGEAIYHGGRIWANTYRQDSSSNNSRQRISGSVRIVANFDMSSLSGRIFSIRGSEPGSRNRVSWPTSSFSISDGQINSEGQFTATLTGLDSDPNAPFSESVRGFVGQILGQFFGPNAEELGGVLSASRDVTGTDDDRNLYGYIASKQIGPAKTLGSTGFIAGILSDFSAETSQLRDSSAMAMVERTESGWTATVNGREFEWSDSDIGRNPRFPNSYLNPLSDGEDVWLWTYTRGFWKNSEFNHFDVKGWSFEEKNSPEDYTSSTYDYIVHGDVTSSSAMPTSGTATYDGRMEAIEFPSDDAVFSASSTRYWGDIALTADFTNSGVNGVIDNLQSRVGSGSYSSANGGATFNAEISGSNITATDLSGTGDLSGYQNGNVRGAFFGPSAEEAAGVFDAQDQANDKILIGWFGTAKDE